MGMSAQGYFDDQGTWIPTKELVGIDPEGRAVAFVPSTLGEPQKLQGPHPAQDLLDLQVDAVYAREPVEAAAAYADPTAGWQG